MPHFPTQRTALTIRLHSGLSGDMLLAGLLRMQAIPQSDVDALLTGLVPSLHGSVRLVPHSVNNIGGWQAQVTLPEEHEHRNVFDIQKIIDESPLQNSAKACARDTFQRMARAEAAVHGKSVEEVHFHEVGALDSIVDICLACELFARLAPHKLVVSPIPVTDGSVHCAHGVLPAPAYPPAFAIRRGPVRGAPRVRSVRCHPSPEWG